VAKPQRGSGAESLLKALGTKTLNLEDFWVLDVTVMTEICPIFSVLQSV